MTQFKSKDEMKLKRPLANFHLEKYETSSETLKDRQLKVEDDEALRGFLITG